MPTSVFALIVLAGAALYFMSADERKKLARSVIAAATQAIGAARRRSDAPDPFDEFLRARTGRPIVTPLIVAVNVGVFACLLFNRTAADAAHALIDWGGNYGPRTTNGEWWRLVAAMFVHDGVLHLAANMIGLVPAGLILERALGRLSFAAVYLSAGIIANVVILSSTSPLGVSAGAAGAVAGMYGLLAATLAWTVVSRASMSVPLHTVKQIGLAAAVFVLYTLATSHLSTASELAGLGTGFVYGLVVARGVAREKPPLRRAAIAMAATAVVAVAAVIPLRGIVDARPELASVAAVEERTAGAYEAAVAKFKRGRLPAAGLVQLIDRTIIPDLQAVRARVSALRGVPREQAALVAAAGEYCQLREQSWRRRAEGLRRSNMSLLRDAEKTERAALEVFQRMRPYEKEPGVQLEPGSLPDNSGAP